MRRSFSGIGWAGMRSSVLLSLLLTLFAAAPVAAQVRIFGRVIDDVTERALAYAEISLLDRDGRVLTSVETDVSGTFSFEVDERVRGVHLEARRLGYQDNTTPLLRFDGRRFFQVEVRLDLDAILLAPLEVVSWSRVDPSALLDDFRRRVDSGMGIYITRDQIETRRPMYITDMLRDVPGLTVTGSGSGLRPVVQTARAQLPTSNCATQIFVDGFLMNKRTPWSGGPIDFRIDDLVSPSSVEGIEIYRGVASVPAQFLNADATSCGVIAIWTKRGGRG